MDAASKAEIAALAPLVFEAARSGDAVAASITTDAAAALRDHIIAILDLLEPARERGAGAAPTELTLALWGGLIGDSGWLRPSLERMLEPLGLAIRQGPIDPAFGAARLAARLWGRRPTAHGPSRVVRANRVRRWSQLPTPKVAAGAALPLSV